MGETQHMDRALWQEPRARGQLGAALLCPSSAEAPSCCSFAEPRVRVCYYKHFITFCVQSLTSPCAGAAKTASLKLLLNALLFFYNFFPPLDAQLSFYPSYPRILTPAFLEAAWLFPQPFPGAVCSQGS